MKLSILNFLAVAATTFTLANAGPIWLSEQDLEDSLVGSSYLGTGGGGSIEEARALIATDVAAGLNFSMLAVDDLKDDDRVATPYGLGSIAPNSPLEAELEALGDARVENFVEASFHALADYLGTNFSAVILGEIGPLSMAEGMSIAARLNVPVTDADTVGRATPEINQHSVRVSNNSLLPASGVTEFGDVVILPDLAIHSRQEDIFRSIAATSGVIGVTDSPLTGDIAKQPMTLVQGSFSLAIAIGAAVREAQEAGEDPIVAAVEAGDGYLLFEGTVQDFEWEDTAAFLEGNLTLSGTGEFEGHSMFTEFKNEHLVAMVGDVVVATAPDLITVVDMESYEGIGNPDFTIGQEVAVIGYRCAPIWRTPEGLAVFEPRYWGYDIDYVPIEDRFVANYPLEPAEDKEEEETDSTSSSSGVSRSPWGW